MMMPREPASAMSVVVPSSIADLLGSCWLRDLDLLG